MFLKSKNLIPGSNALPSFRYRNGTDYRDDYNFVGSKSRRSSQNQSYMHDCTIDKQQQIEQLPENPLDETEMYKKNLQDIVDYKTKEYSNGEVLFQFKLPGGLVFQGHGTKDNPIKDNPTLDNPDIKEEIYVKKKTPPKFIIKDPITPRRKNWKSKYTQKEDSPGSKRACGGEYSKIPKTPKYVQKQR